MVTVAEESAQSWELCPLLRAWGVPSPATASCPSSTLAQCTCSAAVPELTFHPTGLIGCYLPTGVHTSSCLCILKLIETKLGTIRPPMCKRPRFTASVSGDVPGQHLVLHQNRSCWAHQGLSSLPSSYFQFTLCSPLLFEGPALLGFQDVALPYSRSHPPMLLVMLCRPAACPRVQCWSPLLSPRGSHKPSCPHWASVPTSVCLPDAHRGPGTTARAGRIIPLPTRREPRRAQTHSQLTTSPYNPLPSMLSGEGLVPSLRFCHLETLPVSLTLYFPSLPI